MSADNSPEEDPKKIDELLCRQEELQEDQGSTRKSYSWHKEILARSAGRVLVEASILQPVSSIRKWLCWDQNQWINMKGMGPTKRQLSSHRRQEHQHSSGNPKQHGRSPSRPNLRRLWSICINRVRNMTAVES